MPTTDNSLKQIIIGVLILLTATTILGATGWNFTQVASLPEVYMKKSEIIAFMKENREDHIAIENKLDRLLTLILMHNSQIENMNYINTEEDDSIE